MRALEMRVGVAGALRAAGGDRLQIEAQRHRRRRRAARPRRAAHVRGVRTFAQFSPQRRRSIKIALPTPEAMTAWSTAPTALDADAVAT